MMKKSENKKKCDFNLIRIRLHKINGQISVVERMLNEKHNFTDILQQLIVARDEWYTAKKIS